MMLIYIRTGVRSLSEQSQLQPHFHSKARQLSTQLLNVLFVNLTVVLLSYLSTSIERPLQDSNPDLCDAVAVLSISLATSLVALLAVGILLNFCFNLQFKYMNFLSSHHIYELFFRLEIVITVFIFSRNPSF